MKDLSIDIETFSSVDITKSGLYRYAQSPDFQVLLFAYSADGGPVGIVDIAQGEELPPEIYTALFDPNVTKHAYNAAFEWYCLTQFFGRQDSRNEYINQWRCTMLHGLYCGYPGSLAAIGAAIGLPEDKRKLAVGRSLIRKFCVPCAPTKSNGGRTRNLPKHEPEQWELFKEYCRQDVVTEMAVDEKLASFPVPEQVQKQWETDMVINARGVQCDSELVSGALRCSAESTERLMDEAVALTGLDNPNSVAKLKVWLEIELDEELDTLRKSDVTELLGKEIESASARRVLRIRQELCKTSVKKYAAMEQCLCADGRIRGLLQFYGAGRTGRWAGRLVQVQNLPQTHVEPLDTARELTRGGLTDALSLIYGSVPDTLSQLIRTAFIAPEGHLLVDADFSAIEARVIAWLADEQWRLDVFNTHGKIYEASASQMFGVPIDRIKKGNPEYALRQKGKVAELALGYGGSSGALKNMGALKMGLTEEELPDIVSRWRDANRRIKDLWYAYENAALLAVSEGKPTMTHKVMFAREYDALRGQDFMTITLPSGRKLFYAKPFIGQNRFGGESICYSGVNQTSRKVETIETYGGKLTENITQAVARDCLAESIERLEAAGYPVVFHVHDEVCIDVEESRADLADVCRLMAIRPKWAQDLPLKAEGYVSKYFKKE